jgi:hypothetical protein
MHANKDHFIYYESFFSKELMIYVCVPKRIPLLGVDECTTCVAGDTIQTKKKGD